jgi:drug/metabolite transporter (DMT)-like permease
VWERLLADGSLLLATLVWGATFVVVRDAIREISPLLFVALRFSLATLLVAPFVLAARGMPDPSATRAGAFVGLWLYCGFALQTLGLRGTEPARAAFITALSVVLVPPLLVLIYGRRPSRRSLLGVVLATAGLGLLAGPQQGVVRGSDFLVLGGAAGFAMQIVAVGRYAAAVGPATLLFVQLATVAVLAWPSALLLEPLRVGRGSAGWLGVLATALLATIGALGAQNYAQQHTPPTRAAVILTLEPVFAAITSFLLTAERFGSREIAGSLLIVGGMLAAELLPASAVRSR